MRKLFLLAAALALSGCSTLFQNRVACTVDGKRAFFLSEYMNVSVGAEIHKTDAEVICTIATVNALAHLPPTPAPQQASGAPSK